MSEETDKTVKKPAAKKAAPKTTKSKASTGTKKAPAKKTTTKTSAASKTSTAKKTNARKTTSTTAKKTTAAKAAKATETSETKEATASAAAASEESKMSDNTATIDETSKNENADNKENIVEALKDRDWTDILTRGFWMLLFGFLGWIAIVAGFALSVVQFIVSIVTEEPNPTLTKAIFGVGKLLGQIFSFLSFETDDKPFPLGDDNPFDGI